MTYVPWSGWMDDRFPKITQEIEEGGKGIGYIANMRNSATAGFRYFDCRGIRKIKIRTKGYANGKMEIRTAWDGEAIGSVPIGSASSRCISLSPGRDTCSLPGLSSSGNVFGHDILANVFFCQLRECLQDIMLRCG